MALIGRENEPLKFESVSIIFIISVFPIAYQSGASLKNSNSENSLKNRWNCNFKKPKKIANQSIAYQWKPPTITKRHWFWKFKLKKPVPEIPDDGYKKSNFYSFFFRFFDSFLANSCWNMVMIICNILLEIKRALISLVCSRVYLM
jgi:hypothetical protein